MANVNSICVKYGLNEGYKIPVKIFHNEKFRKAHNRFFGDIDTGTLESKTQAIADIVDYAFDDGVKDKNLHVLKYFISRLLTDKNLNNDKIELVNIIYSTAIKKIKPEDILEKRISASKFRQLIEDSIKNYYRHPVGKEVDYRHIAGRMLNHKNMSELLPRDVTDFSAKNIGLKWDEENQADFLGILERILQFFEASPESFKRSKGFMSQNKRVDFSYEDHQKNFYNNIPKLLELTLSKIRNLMHDPITNKNEIEDKLDIAYYYFDKVPYDNPVMPRMIKIFSKLRKQEKKLVGILSNKVKRIFNKNS